MKYNYAICQELIATHSGETAPDEIVLFREGQNDYTGYSSVMMDEESSAVPIEHFNNRGVEVPIDFEHSTIYKGGNAEPAPAAGWIFELFYKKDVGLVAKVKWGPEATKMIESKQYKYHSPVAKIKDNKVVSIHSVALTNSPRTKEMNELLAAKLTAQTGEKDMAKKGKKKTADTMATLTMNCSRKKLESAFSWLIAEEVLPGVDVDTAELPEEAVEQIDEVGQKLEELKAVVMEMTEGTGEETAVEVIDMAIGLLAGGEPVEASKKAKETEKLAATLCAKLGVKGTDMKKAITKVDKMMVGSVPADEFKSVQDQLKELKAAEDSRNADLLVASFVETGQLNPNNPDKMEWALKGALDNPEGFKTLMEDAPVIVPPGQVTKTDGDSKPRTERSGLIASLSSEFDSNPDKMGPKLKKKSYINSSLQDAGESYLDDKELETLKISG